MNFNPKGIINLKFFKEVFFSGLFFILSMIWILIQPIENIIKYAAIDDGLYYPKIALNFIRTGVFTFDGVTTTNGFHPLWQLIIIPVFYFISDHLLALKSAYFLIFIILSSALILLIKISKDINLSFSSLYFLAFIVVFNLRSFTVFYSLLESHLLLFFYLVFIYYSKKYSQTKYDSNIRAFFFGILVSLSFLARLDSFLLFVSIMAINFINYYRERKFLFTKNGLISFIVGVSIFVLPYLAINYFYFGTISTVSSWMKFYYPSTDIVLNPILNFFQQMVPRISYITNFRSATIIYLAIGLLILILTVVVWDYLLNRQKVVKSISLVIYEFVKMFPEFVLFAMMHFVFVYFFAPGEALFSVWYYISELIVLGLFVAFVINKMKNRYVNYIVAFSVSVLLIIQILTFDDFLEKKKMTTAKLEVAEFIKQKLDRNVKIGMYDSGIVSFFSNHNLFALNGLIGDFEFASLIKKGELNNIAEKYGIEYFIWDMNESQINDPNINVVFKSNTATLFHNFNEGEKSIVVFRPVSIKIEDWLKTRYNN